MIYTFPIRSVDEIELSEDSKVLVRVDFDISVTNGQIEDDFRLQTSFQTLAFLLEKGCRLLLIAHRGRPKGIDNTYTLLPIVSYLHTHFPHTNVLFAPDISTAHSLLNSHPHSIILLENIRFWEGEEKNDASLAHQLAECTNIYVNESFANSHRAHASMIGIPQYIPHAGGFHLRREIETILQHTHNATRPLVVILGGAKISTKVDLIYRLLDMADTILIGGALSNLFINAQGYSIGKSLGEKEYTKHAQEILHAQKTSRAKIILPSDVVVTTSPNSSQSDINIINSIADGTYIVDIGPATTSAFQTHIKDAKTIFWNGPLGYCENKHFAEGTQEILQHVASNQHAFSLVGGGDTISVLNNYPEYSHISYASSGGGAMLELIEKGTLPAIEALL